MHYYKRNLGDYAKRTRGLSILEHGTYTLLIDSCYDRERFPTRSDAIDWLCAKSAAEIQAVDNVLRKFFEKEGDFYVQKRVQEELEKYRKKSIKNREIALNREASKREKNTKRTRNSTKRAQNEQEREPNQEPLLTINNSNELLIPLGTRATRLQKNWLPDNECIVFCRQTRPDLDPGAVVSEFVDYWTSVPGGRGAKLDWSATWRNWVRRQRAVSYSAPAQQKKWIDSLTGHHDTVIDI